VGFEGLSVSDGGVDAGDISSAIDVGDIAFVLEAVDALCEAGEDVAEVFGLVGHEGQLQGDWDRCFDVDSQSPLHACLGRCWFWVFKFFVLFGVFGDDSFFCGFDDTECDSPTCCGEFSFFEGLVCHGGLVYTLGGVADESKSV